MYREEDLYNQLEILTELIAKRNKMLADGVENMPYYKYLRLMNIFDEISENYLNLSKICADVALEHKNIELTISMERIRE